MAHCFQRRGTATSQAISLELSLIGSALPLYLSLESETMVTSLPAAFGSLASLTSLSLSQNTLDDISFESICKLKNLQTLCVSSLFMLLLLLLSFVSLHWNASACRDLSECGIHHLPTAIGSLTALRSLHLDGNSLTLLPNGFSSLTLLDALCSGLLPFFPHLISRCSHSSSSFSFIHLCRKLSKNTLLTLPTEIGSLTSLAFFLVDDNKLTELPSEMATWKRLLTINSVNNYLAEYPTLLQNSTASFVENQPALALPLQRKTHKCDTHNHTENP